MSWSTSVDVFVGSNAPLIIMSICLMSMSVICVLIAKYPPNELFHLEIIVQLLIEPRQFRLQSSLLIPQLFLLLNQCLPGLGHAFGLVHGVHRGLVGLFQKVVEHSGVNLQFSFSLSQTLLGYVNLPL